MPYKGLFNIIPSCFIAAALSLGFTSLAQAADAHTEIKTDIKPQPSRPEGQPQQPIPSQPSSETEPVDGDDTALV